MGTEKKVRNIGLILLEKADESGPWESRLVSFNPKGGFRTVGSRDSQIVTKKWR